MCWMLLVRRLAFDVVCKVLDPVGGAMAVVSPVAPKDSPEGIRVEFTDVERAHGDDREMIGSLRKCGRGSLLLVWGWDDSRPTRMRLSQWS